MRTTPTLWRCWTLFEAQSRVDELSRRLFAQGLLRLTSANAGKASVITPSTPGHHVRPLTHAAAAWLADDARSRAVTRGPTKKPTNPNMGALLAFAFGTSTKISAH